LYNHLFNKKGRVLRPVKSPLAPPLTGSDNPSGHDVRLQVKEANIVPLVKGEAEEDLGGELPNPARCFVRPLRTPA